MENKKVVFKVYGKDEIEQEIKEVYFKATEYWGNPAFVACDKKGTALPGGLIAQITPEGKLKLFHNVAHDIGLVRRSNTGQVAIED